MQSSGIINVHQECRIWISEVQINKGSTVCMVCMQYYDVSVYAGINELDEILLINDTAVTQMTLEEVKSAFKGLFISFMTCWVVFLY